MIGDRCTILIVFRRFPNKWENGAHMHYLALYRKGIRVATKLRSPVKMRAFGFAGNTNGRLPVAVPKG